MMKTYKANKKGPIIYIMLAVFIYLAISYLIHKEAISEKPYLFVPFIFLFVLGFWIYFDTFYRIKNDRLMYRLAFFRGEVEIKNIREIIIGKSIWTWAGMKPALSGDGMVIKFNRFDDIFIAPENKEELIADLLELNDTIILTEKKEE